MDLESLPRTAKEAKALGAKFYFTGLVCPHGHTSKRRTANKACIECARTVHYSVESSRNAMYRAKYGMDRIAIDALHKKQNGKCAICDRKLNRHGQDYHFRANEASVVDHDHATGRVRGILCQKCNKGLGQFEDNALTMIRAIQYLLETAKEGAN